MNAAARLAVYSLGLVAIFVTSLGVGAAVGPTSSTDDTTKEADVSGLQSSEEGYTFVPEATALEPGRRTDFAFRITGPDGAAVRAFRPQHERDLHLIVASRDLTWFAHVHPARDTTGRWTVPLELPAPGPYRAFADFAPVDGPALTLGVDVTALGEHRPRPWPAPAATAEVDGYAVTLSDAPTQTGEAEINLHVTRNGRPVTDLQPYLGAYGHVVALRSGDLGYLHVHPDGHPGDGQTAAGPDVRFGLHLPTPGDYRLFFDFQHDGVVRTAAFSVTVAADGDAPRAPTTTGSHGDTHR